MVEVLEVWELDSDGAVHGREAELSVSLHPVLVQGGTRAQQPQAARRPPQPVVGPVYRQVCNGKGEKCSERYK